MISFESDYICGAHPEVMKRLEETNLERHTGYGMDEYCESARRKIREAVGMEDAEVEFLVGGTQTNAVVISTMLADCEGVIAAPTGHVSTHEAGAVEYTGHKVLELPPQTAAGGGGAAHDGKIDAGDLREFLETFYSDGNREHMVYPGMVYISYPTEFGTLYSRSELEGLSEVCRRYGIPLFIDGARLGYGLMSPAADVTLRDIAELCDVFYIGGTKMGALCGEAVVFTKGNKPERFVTLVKQRGGLLAKGWLLGVQFDALFTDDLYFRIGRYADGMAERMKAMFLAKGLELAIDSPTNQQFPVLENGQMEKLAEKAAFTFWEKKDENHTVVRFAASWSTTEEDMQALEEALEEL